MLKNKSLIMVLVLSILVSMLIPAMAFAADPYLRDFTDNDVSSFAQVKSGTVTFIGEEGVLKAETLGNTFFIDNSCPDLSDGIYEAKIASDVGGTSAGRFGLVVKYSDANNYLLIANEGGFWGWETNSNWNYNFLAEVPVANQEYALKVKVEGQNVTLWVNGTEMFSTTVASMPTAAGKVGFRSWWAAKTLQIDDIKYSALEVTVPATVTEITPTSISTVAGTAPVLPAVVTATYSDNTTKELAVTWAAVEPSSYASAGTFTVEGTVAETAIKAIATVTVTAAPVVVGAVELTGPNSVILNGQFTLNLGLKGVTDTMAEDITITYNPESFEYVDVLSVTSSASIVAIDSTVAGIVRILAASEGSINTINGDKAIINITFKVIKALPAGDTVSVSAMTIANSLGTEFDLSPVSKTIKTITTDVNHDNKISIGDLGIISRYYGFNSMDAEWEQAYIADINGDNKVGIEDVVIIAKMILGL